MEITISQAAQLCGRDYSAIWYWNAKGVGGNTLPFYKRGKYNYIDEDEFHAFLLKIDPKHYTMDPNYVTPFGQEPLDITPRDGLSVQEASAILAITTQRVYILIETGKLDIVTNQYGTQYITPDSLELHLKRAEQWHYIRNVENARKEVYGDLIKDAHNEAKRKAYRKAQNQTRAAKSHNKGRPKGSSDRKRRKLVNRPDKVSEEYELK